MANGGDSSKTLLDRYWDAIKNNRVLAVILFMGVCIVGIGAATDSIEKIIGFVERQFGWKQRSETTTGFTVAVQYVADNRANAPFKSLRNVLASEGLIVRDEHREDGISKNALIIVKYSASDNGEARALAERVAGTLRGLILANENNLGYTVITEAGELRPKLIQVTW